MEPGHNSDNIGDEPVGDDGSFRDDESVLDDGSADQSVVDWRSRVSAGGLIIGSAMIGLERVFFPEKNKDETEQVDDQPLDDWPRLSFGSAELEQLGPDDDGYWP